MEVGVLVQFNKDHDVDVEFKKVHDFGMKSCQLCGWDMSMFTEEMAEKVKEAAKKHDVKVSVFWCGWRGPAVWDFYDGPLTLGLVPVEYRYQRMQELMQGSDFAKMIGVDIIATHVGFIPENPNTVEYHSLIAAVKHVAQHCKNNGQKFIFETGQETPVTLRRAIEDIGLDNLGINLDPANLILYGKANPVDALDIFGEYVMNIHAKDGMYPTDGKNLGKEVPIGEGKVNFPAFIAKLKEIGYDSYLTIEREISGDQQIADIKNAKVYLEELLKR